MWVVCDSDDETLFVGARRLIEGLTLHKVVIIFIQSEEVIQHNRLNDGQIISQANGSENLACN
jgi:hypothetical protein